MTIINRSEMFGRLLKAGIASIANCEGKTAPIVEDELGADIGVVGKSVQRYKAGYLPPDPRTVRILAEACVRRGYMNRDWLHSFLHAARYHQTDLLLDQLCPLGPMRPRPPRVYENLPAPTYSQFVMRPQAFSEVADGLSKRTAVVLIIGFGGNGKTSLAREIAARCLHDDSEVPHFDAVVWVSDKGRSGATNLSVVLDEIARTLDYPGFTQFAYEEKRREVEQLLRRQRVLLVVDNFETITDGALLTWLLDLPEPSKALITTREYRREWRSSWPVELRGMTEAEAQELIVARLKILRIERLVSDITQLEPLITATGGNPKAIELTLGLVKFEGRPLPQVVDDLYAARGELFEDLFSRAWVLLDEAARRVLMVATFFPLHASVEALSVSANVHSFAFDRAVERLADLTLLDMQQEDLSSPLRYTLHPLIRAFASAKIAELPEFAADARQRWVGWYADLATQVGFCWHDLNHLKRLDREQEAIVAVIDWAYQNQLDALLLQITKGVSYYYYVRGLWMTQPPVDLIRSVVARKLGDFEEEVRAISHFVTLLIRQGRIVEAREHIDELHTLVQSTALHGDTLFIFFHALALTKLAENEFEQARHYCQICIDNIDELSTPFRILSQHWLAKSLYLLGQVAEAKTFLNDALKTARRHGYFQGVIAIQTYLASIYLDEMRDEEAEHLLLSCKDLASQYGDRTNIAEILRSYAHIAIFRGDLDAARAYLKEAIDLLERMGIQRQLQKARDNLALISAGQS
jgi:tetratricopeptide (TPR) repeat protein